MAFFFDQAEEDCAAGSDRKEYSAASDGYQSTDPRIGIACSPHDGTNAEDLPVSAEQDVRHRIKRRQQ
jgi:hypothetical protein